MPRLIDADALMRDLLSYTVYSSNQYCMGIAKGIELCQKDVNDAPTIDAEPVRHGTWKLGVSEKPLCISACKCSECGRFIYPGVRLPEITRKYLSEIFPYCHCGAKMDGGVSDEG